MRPPPRSPASPRPASLVAVAALLVSTAAPAASQDPAAGRTPAPDRGAAVEQDPLSGLDGYVRAAMETWRTPGLALAVVHDDSVVYSRGFGTRAAGSDRPVDRETLFAIGSTTKAMTAAVLGTLVDEGALDWDDRVVEHLPRFRLSDPWVTSELTVRDLLVHRSGLPNTYYLWVDPDAETDEIVRRLRLVDPAYSFRSDFVYQNLMYATAGEVAEAASGTSWEALVRERIFGPLGMDRSVTSLARAERASNVAAPHALVDGDLTVIENASADPIAPAGAVWSSVDDMARWIRFLVDDCRTPEGERLLERATCEELFSPQVVLDADAYPYPTARLTGQHWSTYGLAWFQHDYEGRKIDFHTGSIAGMVAIAGLIREEDLGVYVLANRDHAELRHALMYRVFDLFDEGPPRDWSADVKALYDRLSAREDSARAARDSALRAGRVEGTSPSRPLEAYAGTYRDPLYGTVRVELRGGTLRLAWGSIAGRLVHWHHDLFRMRASAEWRRESLRWLLRFELDASGRPVRLEVVDSELGFERAEATGADDG